MALEQGLRGARHRPAEQLVQHRPDRAPLRRPPQPRREAVPALRRPGRWDRPAGDPDPGEAGRGVQPGRPVPRAGELRGAGLHRAVRRPGDHQPSGGGPGHGAAGAVLPGQQQRDVRQGGPDAAERDDAFPRAKPVRLRQGVQLLADRELPGELRDVRVQRHPVQPRERAARRDLRHPQDHPCGHPDQGRAPGKAVLGQPRREARLGPRRGLRRGDVADGPARQGR